ncbi:hypothetical protein [Aurantibacillus circumpalustris]|uniref:hypothetical protein n=1 Tax=Aurantibacillus circumpalustris TaxID=3036359 RepID=UPI00295B72CB|nr:hypothetical protein [Aurantibacillus circumpalustris]
MKKTITILLSAVILMSCGDSNKADLEAALMNQPIENTQNVSISRDVLDEMMQTLPSPIETANLITQAKSSFDKTLLIPAQNAVNFPNKYAQALALGGYGVDLGYINLNNKMLYVVEYLESVNTISKELKVNQFLDFSTLNNLAKNRNNVDSLIRISTENFNHIDEYLRSKERGDLSVLILVGSWVEGLHMFNNIARHNPSPEITKRIGEQKIIINNIYAILNKIDKVAYYRELKEKLKGLKDVYANVKISYVYKEPITKEVNGELVIEDGSESVIEMTKADMDAIDKEITKLRNSIFIVYK